MFVVFYITGGELALKDSNSTLPIGLGSVGAIPVAFTVWVIGLSLGGPTGYAINPARDLAPRFMHFLLPIKGKGSSHWNYSCFGANYRCCLGGYVVLYFVECPLFSCEVLDEINYSKELSTFVANKDCKNE